MTDPTPRPPEGRNGPDDPGTRSSGLANWQKVVGIIGLAVVVVLVIVLATGDHGPGRHAPAGSQPQPTNVEDAPGHNASNQNHRWAPTMAKGRAPEGLS